MRSGPKALLGTGPFVGTGALSQRGKHISLRMGSVVYLPGTSSPSICHATYGSTFGIGLDNSTAALNYYYSGTVYASINQSGVVVQGAARLGFASGVPSTTLSAFFTYQAAGVMNMGVGVASTIPVHQALKGNNAATDTFAGANQVIAGGAGWGTGRGGDVIHKTHESVTANASHTAESVPRYQAVAKHVTLTEASATTICTFAVGSGKFIGVVVDAVVNASDATDYQCQTSRLIINAVQKSGTTTATITQVDGTSACSAGTLTATYTVVDAGAGNITLKCNATSSLTQTTLECRFVIVSYSGNGVEAITATTLITPA